MINSSHTIFYSSYFIIVPFDKQKSLITIYVITIIVSLIQYSDRKKKYDNSNDKSLITKYKILLL